MAFKKKGTSSSVPASPDLLFRELSRRQLPDVLPIQQYMMQEYASKGINEKDVALQLPTGSGKTLVGLLIAEWRRRKNQERIVYLCPTRQLVHQTVEQAEKKYGLTVVGFTGKKRDYNPSDIHKFKQGMNVAVTTYSSLFNTNPFFNDSDVIIIDDAHAAENYVSKLWSLEIDGHDSSQLATFIELCSLLKPKLETSDFSRLTGDWDNPNDRDWVEKLPAPDFYEIKDELIQTLDQYTSNTSLHFPWSMIRENLQACNLYLSANSILIRPLIPPTWTLEAYANAKQRIYMSATLGEGGDLERLFGRKRICRLKAPIDWESRGVGRRFFMFPGMSLDEDDSLALEIELMKKANRSVVLVPSERVGNNIRSKIDKETNLSLFSASDIEQSKDDFIRADAAVAVIANRYDGIDFSGDECRLLIIEGLPKSVNDQERFLMSRIGAVVLFNERVQTRVIQAIGRCTRSLQDYSAVVINGTELTDYLTSIKRRKNLHVELQAELKFGVDQSLDVNPSDFLENFDTFFEHGEEWEDVNSIIVDYRSGVISEKVAGLNNLEDSVGDEIDFVKSLWNRDYVKAISCAESALSYLKVSELRGYRAMWEYFAGCAALLAEAEQQITQGSKSVRHFKNAKDAAKSVPWLSRLSKHVPNANLLEGDDKTTEIVMMQVENIERKLESLGIASSSKFIKAKKAITEGLNTEKGFEEAHRAIGELIGFNAFKVEADGSPDPWWQLEGICFVFEDYANAEKESALSVNKARQASSHPSWLRTNQASCQGADMQIIPVLISPIVKVKQGAVPHIDGLKHWNLADFKLWVGRALEAITEIRTTFAQSGDLVWRTEAASLLVQAGIDANSLIKFFEINTCERAFSVVK